MAEVVDKEILMPIPVQDQHEQLHLVLLRQLIEGMKSVNAELHQLRDAHLDVAQRITAMESNRVDERIAETARRAEKNEERITALERVRNQSDGALGLVKWAQSSAPWFLALIGAAVAYFTKK